MQDKNKLIVPKKIKVGFQKRPDTYTGQLAFVIYTDAKGVLRKQKSWDGWRDKKITAQDFDNVPTSGFVLNKKVGGTRYGWNPRQTYVRVYDPRNFELEITVPNLVFILEETSAIKGKGLEGEFVYAWDKTELVLLPASSQEYKQSVQFTQLQTQKVTQKDMVEGCLYQNKDNQQVMYLGRQDWYQRETSYAGNRTVMFLKQSKQHIFVSVDGKSQYWPQTGFTKLAVRLTQDPSPLFAEEFDKFKNSAHNSPIKGLIAKPWKFKKPKNNYGHKVLYSKNNDLFYPMTLSFNDYNKEYRIAKGKTPIDLKDNKLNLSSEGYYYSGSNQVTSPEELENLELYEVFLENQKGALIKIQDYETWADDDQADEDLLDD